LVLGSHTKRRTIFVLVFVFHQTAKPSDHEKDLAGMLEWTFFSLCHHLSYLLVQCIAAPIGAQGEVV